MIEAIANVKKNLCSTTIEGCLADLCQETCNIVGAIYRSLLEADLVFEATMFKRIVSEEIITEEMWDKAVQILFFKTDSEKGEKQ